ncbi:DUF3987 domain-containing protein [Desulfovibrio desulfuricans]|uniref:DUF3987 domain-containing protein n=1 Tax=Desulfovibrio desulfuricans TaxID=876 RepID=UPI001C023BED|nr:DUF3987 domain-containing protein [Desulfovibrio desulfuricans]MBT9748664.1 DUF3987 domain-containing protein [Desulfovibrio desulfuricans]
MKNFFSSKNTSLEAALHYADKKIPVFPVIFYDTTKTFGCISSFSEATTDKKTIVQWFTENPAALVVIPTGEASGIVAISVDEGTTFTAKTPCFTGLFGKKTYLFKLPEGENFGSGKGGGLEWKGDLGSVVLPSPLAIVADGELEVLPDEIAAKMKEVSAAEVVAGQEEADQGEEEEQENGELPGLPLECLPPQLAQIIRGVSKVFCVSPWLPFAAALRTSSTIIGANIQLEHRQVAPAHLWLCLVGEPSSGKTEICRFFNASVYRMQQFYCKSHENAMEEYKNLLQKYEEEKKLAEKGGTSPALKKPVQPTKTALYVDDITPESLVTMLKDNPGGLSWDCDEIKTLLSSFGRYGGNGSGDAAKSRLLSMYSGAPIKLDRKGAESALMIQQGWLSIFGTTQPSILPTLFNKDDRGSGFLQRFMFIHSEQTTPTPRATRPYLTDFSTETEQIFGDMLMQVVRVEPNNEESKPVFIRIEKKGQEILDKFCDEMTKEAFYLSGNGEEAEESKSRAGRWCEQLPRLILIIHALEKCCGYGQIASMISEKTVVNAIKIFQALQKHSCLAWDKIRGKTIKKEKNNSILEIVEKYLDKSSEITFSLLSTEKIDSGKTKFDAILEEIGGKYSSIATKQKLTKALIEVGFHKQKINVGTKFTISKKDFEKAVGKIKKEDDTKMPMPAMTNEQAEFLEELTNGIF